ncbi:MAG TPA: flagellar motor protein MotB [Desulfobacteria bacterium]|nr:flagellar motor protein MotB [Desulfobacteria bacterium]
MVRRSNEPEKAANHERWLLTYADLITLLMIFFVLMYTISNINSKKFADLSASMSKALLGQNSGKILGEAVGQFPIKESLSQQVKIEAQNMQKAQLQIEKLIKEHGLGGKVEVSQESRGLIISLKEALLFESGSATITPEARLIVVQVGHILRLLPNQMRIEGHTDNLPIHTSAFPSNWELSTGRATNMVKMLINEVGMGPERFSVAGYGEYRPIASNDNEYNRARNRRVDIVVLKSAFDLAEPKITEEQLKDIAE